MIKLVSLEKELTVCPVTDGVHSVLNRMNKLGKKANTFAHGIKEHGKPFFLPYQNHHAV